MSCTSSFNAFFCFILIFIHNIREQGSSIPLSFLKLPNSSLDELHLNVLVHIAICGLDFRVMVSKCRFGLSPRLPILYYCCRIRSSIKYSYSNSSCDVRSCFYGVCCPLQALVQMLHLFAWCNDLMNELCQSIRIKKHHWPPIVVYIFSRAASRIQS